MMRRILPLLAIAGLSACGSGGQQDGVGGVSASDARALNDAAARLDAQDSARGGAPGLNPAATAAAGADRDRTPPAPQPQTPSSR
jgi:uncharacterized lipoprotein